MIGFLTVTAHFLLMLNAHRRADAVMNYICFIAFLLGMSSPAVAGVLGPSNEQECVKKYVPRTKSDNASLIVEGACRDFFSNDSKKRKEAECILNLKELYAVTTNKGAFIIRNNSGCSQINLGMSKAKDRLARASDNGNVNSTVPLFEMSAEDYLSLHADDRSTIYNAEADILCFKRYSQIKPDDKIEEIIDVCTQAAISGAQGSQYALGMIYLGQNTELATFWLKEAAKNGHAGAQEQLKKQRGQ